MLESLLSIIIDAILLGICIQWGRRAREQQGEIRRLHRNEEWLNDRIGTVVDLYAKREELAELTEAVNQMKDGVVERNQAEARMFDGLTNIFNYDLSQARKAVSDDAG